MILECQIKCHVQYECFVMGHLWLLACEGHGPSCLCSHCNTYVITHRNTKVSLMQFQSPLFAIAWSSRTQMKSMNGENRSLVTGETS
jgi:hypothetical protein